MEVCYKCGSIIKKDPRVMSYLWLIPKIFCKKCYSLWTPGFKNPYLLYGGGGGIPLNTNLYRNSLIVKDIVLIIALIILYFVGILNLIWSFIGFSNSAQTVITLIFITVVIGALIKIMSEWIIWSWGMKKTRLIGI
jgi:hypothetical protein